MRVRFCETHEGRGKKCGVKWAEASLSVLASCKDEPIELNCRHSVEIASEHNNNPQFCPHCGRQINGHMQEEEVVESFPHEIREERPNLRNAFRRITGPR